MSRSVVFFVACAVLTGTRIAPLAVAQSSKVLGSNPKAQSEAVPSDIDFVIQEQKEESVLAPSGSAAQSVDDVVDDQLMMVVESGGPGQTKQLLLQGSSPEDVPVLVDGFRLQDASAINRELDLAGWHLPGEVNVQTSPLSVEASGLGASGGVTVERKRPEPGERWKLRQEVDTLSTFAEGLRFEEGSGPIASRLEIRREDSIGISVAPNAAEKDDYHFNHVHSGFYFNLTSSTHIKTLVDYNSGTASIDKFSPGGGALDDPNYVAQNERFKLALISKTQFQDLNFEVGGQWLRSSRSYRDEVDVDNPFAFDPFEVEANDYQLRGLTKVSWSNWVESRAGAHFTSEDYRSGFGLGLGEPISSRALAVFTDTKIGTDDASHVVGGLRGEFLGGVSEPLFYLKAQSSMGRLKLISQFATGIKRPSLFQKSDPINGTSDLAPERVISQRVGGEVSLTKNWNLRSEAFYKFYQDRIDFDSGTSRFVNRGIDRVPGVETSTKASFGRNEIAAGYVFLLDPLPRRPQHLIRTGYKRKLAPWFDMGVMLTYFGPRSDLVMGKAFALSGHRRLDWRNQFKIGRSVEMDLSLSNLLNEKPNFVFGYASPGRVASLGVSVLL